MKYSPTGGNYKKKGKAAKQLSPSTHQLQKIITFSCSFQQFRHYVTKCILTKPLRHNAVLAIDDAKSRKFKPFVHSMPSRPMA